MKILHPNRLLVCLMFTFLSQFVQAQSTDELKKLCGTKDLAQIEQDDPQHAEQLRIIEERTQHFIQNKTAHKSASAVVTIPVVFHVIHTGTTSTTNNIPDVYLLAQLAQLNDDFRRMNSDADNTWNQAADTEIQFCLTVTAPDGSNTTGINRYPANSGTWTTTNFDNTVKPQTIWDRDSYLNIWVVPNPIASNGDQLLGYAQFPGGTANTDGVVIRTSSTGSIATPNPSGGNFDAGRTGTHEVGHWLNLRHIWGDGGCGVDDLVGDTPLSDDFNRNCAVGHVSCGSVDMVQNYMDYSDDGCMNLFTIGQKNRMMALFQPDGARLSLLSSAGCGTPAAPTCDDGFQNGDETGLDCGGTSCPPCAPCTDVTVTLNLDDYPEETAWLITDNTGDLVASGGNYTSQPANSTVVKIACLTDACYNFEITDEYGDGICCGFGNGSYIVRDADGNTLASGGQFGSLETTNFCLSGVAGWQTCDPIIDLSTQTLTTGTIHAQNELISAGTIPAQTSVSLKAGQSIRLDNGFNVDADADVEINIEDCTSPVPE